MTVLAGNSTLERRTHDHEHPLYHPENAALLDDLLTHVHDVSFPEDNGSELASGSAVSPRKNWEKASVEGLIRMVDEAREAFHRRAAQMRIGYQVFVCIRRALHAQTAFQQVSGRQAERQLHDGDRPSTDVWRQAPNQTGAEARQSRTAIRRSRRCQSAPDYGVRFRPHGGGEVSIPRPRLQNQAGATAKSIVHPSEQDLRRR